eukprot:4561-Prymnesium_polylepis.1
MVWTWTVRLCCSGAPSRSHTRRPDTRWEGEPPVRRLLHHSREAACEALAFPSGSFRDRAGARRPRNLSRQELRPAPLGGVLFDPQVGERDVNHQD